MPALGLAAAGSNRSAEPPAQTRQTTPDPPNKAPNAPQKESAAPQKTGDPATSGEGPADPLKLAEPKPASGAKVPGAAPVNARTYVIGPEDILGIIVYGQRDFSIPSYLVRPDGVISVPLIGEVTAAGHTPEQLGGDIAEQLKKFIKNPDVQVQVLQVHSRKFRIQGEVNRPGEFDLVRPTSVLEALVNAGGFREWADEKNIKIFRDGGKKILKFNYRDVIQGKHLDQNVQVEPNDIIIVR